MAAHMVTTSWLCTRSSTGSTESLWGFDRSNEIRSAETHGRASVVQRDVDNGRCGVKRTINWTRQTTDAVGAQRSTIVRIPILCED